MSMNPTVQLPFQSRALPYLFLCFSLLVFCPLSGCTSWYMMTTPPGEPVDQDIGERTLGSKIEDMNIEAKIRANLLKADKDYRRGDITVTSYNGIVLLTGTVPSASLKQLATKLAQDTRRVRQVHNRLSVGANRSAGQKMHDGWLNFKVKSKLRANRLVPAGRIQVITSNDVAYLMGLLTTIESKRAVQSIAYIDGLHKIVKIFEYISPLPPLSTRKPASTHKKPQRSSSRTAPSHSKHEISLP